MKENLLGKNPEELKAVAVECGLKPFVGRQLSEWLYQKRVSSFGQMTNISNSAKEILAEKYSIGAAAPSGRAVSADGTVKYLFPVECGGEKSAVEAVVIPEDDRRTLCVSSQAGCKMGCRFCMTGRQGWHGNLSPADVLGQFLGVDDPLTLTNAVFMGMGEPLDNYDTLSRVLEVLTADWGFGWSPKRITVSTIGVMPVLRRFLDEQRCHLAVSLHNPFPEERAQMMPVQKAFDEKDIISLIKQYDFTGQRRVSFEYTMFGGWNDSKRHADALIRLLRGLECRVNLIRFHKIPDFPYDSSSPEVMEAFKSRLNNNGITCTIRASRGEDILAACGMLAGKHDPQ
ncbi:MAG: 23S rRNA (adenine(2503)-C(2))-methyltransferase RlmN [Bacteroidales bacterium]|nr:23S rRNA (adenine(2503)-C(2))-methyltransferase RlmN [Bacteroidales bacterium]